MKPTDDLYRSVTQLQQEKVEQKHLKDHTRTKNAKK